MQAAATAPQVLSGPGPAAAGGGAHATTGDEGQAADHQAAAVTGTGTTMAANDPLPGGSTSSSPTAGGLVGEEKVLLDIVGAGRRGADGEEEEDQGGAPTVSSSASDASLISLEQHQQHQQEQQQQEAAEEMAGALPAPQPQGEQELLATLCRRLESMEQEVASLRRGARRRRQRQRWQAEGERSNSAEEEEGEGGPEPPTLAEMGQDSSPSSFHLRLPRRRGKGSGHPGWPLLRSMDTLDFNPAEEGEGGAGGGAWPSSKGTLSSQEEEEEEERVAAATEGLAAVEQSSGLRQRRRPLPPAGLSSLGVGDRGGAAIAESLSAASLVGGEGAYSSHDKKVVVTADGGAAVVSSPVAAAMAAAAMANKQRHRREEGEEREEGLPVVASKGSGPDDPSVALAPGPALSLRALGSYVWHQAFGPVTTAPPSSSSSHDEAGAEGEEEEDEEEEEEGEKADAVVRNFLTVPARLEGCLAFGLAVCVDAFLGALTILPLRAVRAAFQLFFSSSFSTSSGAGGGNRGGVRGAAAQRGAQLHDLLRGLALVAAALVLQSFQISRVYHYIRGQATIKLYVLTAMFEILDKLLVSFGQDALDALRHACVAATAAAAPRGGKKGRRRGGRKRRLLAAAAVACAYVVGHAVLLFVHVVTLFVAVNSSDQALLTLLISNNFAEMKTSVFKRFDAKLLFQLTCSDMVERFKLLLFLALITALNVAQQAGRDPEAVSQVLGDMLQVSCLIFCGEVVADAVKHAFITKFNEIDAACYDRAKEELSRAVLSAHRSGTGVFPASLAATMGHTQRLQLTSSVAMGNTQQLQQGGGRGVGWARDHAHVVCKKVGLAQLPLAAVALRFAAIAFAAFASEGTHAHVGASTQKAAAAVLLFVVLLLGKLACAIVVTRWAAGVEQGERRRREVRAREKEGCSRAAPVPAVAVVNAS